MKNWLVTFITLLFLYAGLEFFALNIFFHVLPRAGYAFIDQGLPFALQTSKRAVMPQGYIAIVGDSYAAGLGDEYYQTFDQYPAGSEYGSAPYIYKALHKDVISFGMPGDGSIAGMVTHPLLAMKYFNKDWRTSLEPPQRILVYFYEGNDFSDNVEYPQYSERFSPFHYQKLEDHEYFESYIQEVAIEKHPWNKAMEEMHWYDQLYLAKFVARVFLVLVMNPDRVLERIQGKPGAYGTPTDSPLNPGGRFGWISPGSINRAWINGVAIQIPDKLQGPSSMVLSEAEIRLSLIFYRESLRFMKKYFPDAAITVVYLPSVISTYDITSSQVSMQYFRKDEGGLYSPDEARQQSDWGAQQIQALTQEQGITFLDARPHIREVAKTALLHGPYDWNHFNKEGYRALADAILQKPVLH